MLPLEPKPPDPCPFLFSFLFWSSPCPDSSLNLMHSVTRVQGVNNLPYSVVDCSSLGNVSSFMRPEWSIRSLRLPPLQPSLAFFDSTPVLGFTGVVIVASAVGFTFVNLPIFWFGSQIRHRFLIQLCEAQSFGRISVLVNLVAYGVLVDVLYQLAGGSFRYTTPNLLLWHLLSVSLHLRCMGFRSEFQYQLSILCLWRSWLHILHLGGMFSDESMFLLWQVKSIWEVYLFVLPRPVSRLPFGLPLVYFMSVFAPWCVHFHENWFCNVHPQYGTAPYGHTWFTVLWFGDIVIAFIHLSWIHDQGLRNDAWIIMALKFHAPEIQDSLVLCALCLNLGLLWAYFSYGNSVYWLIARDSYFAHLYILFHQCNSCHHFMYLLDLLICLLRGNVEIPIRNFPQPSLLWH
uniref:Uncharacterized protein n=1 Tax=Opuntia streptacantha TaxID=393608 RepID=A0A7C9ELS1_OPUST